MFVSSDTIKFQSKSNHVEHVTYIFGAFDVNYFFSLYSFVIYQWTEKLPRGISVKRNGTKDKRNYDKVIQNSLSYSSLEIQVKFLNDRTNEVSKSDEG